MTDPARDSSRDVPYATPYTGKLNGSLVPLISGFALLALGLMTLVFGRGEGNYAGRNSEVVFLLDALVALTGLALAVVGIIVIFRALRKYDW